MFPFELMKVGQRVEWSVKDRTQYGQFYESGKIIAHPIVPTYALIRTDSGEEVSIPAERLRPSRHQFTVKIGTRSWPADETRITNDGFGVLVSLPEAIAEHDRWEGRRAVQEEMRRAMNVARA